VHATTFLISEEKAHLLQRHHRQTLSLNFACTRQISVGMVKKRKKAGK
jgi:hypothetical protein